MQQYFICQQQDIPEYETRSFSVALEQGSLEGFVLKQDGQIRAYLNHCPHLGVPLNWQPDDFMSLEGTHIQCATHGALFNLEDGYCIAGPCAGQSLTALNIKIEADGKVYLVSTAE